MQKTSYFSAAKQPSSTPLCLSVFAFVCLSLRPSLAVCQSVLVFVCQSLCLSVYVTLFVSVSLFFCLSVCMTVWFGVTVVCLCVSPVLVSAQIISPVLVLSLSRSCFAPNPTPPSSLSLFLMVKHNVSPPESSWGSWREVWQSRMARQGCILHCAWQYAILKYRGSNGKKCNEDESNTTNLWTGKCLGWQVVNEW